MVAKLGGQPAKACLGQPRVFLVSCRASPTCHRPNFAKSLKFSFYFHSRCSRVLKCQRFIHPSILSIYSYFLAKYINRFHFSLSPRKSVPTPTLVAACQPPVHGQVVQVQVGGGQAAGVGVVKHLQRRKAKIITRDSRALSGSSITHIYLVKWNFVMKGPISG